MAKKTKGLSGNFDVFDDMASALNRMADAAINARNEQEKLPKSIKTKVTVETKGEEKVEDLNKQIEKLENKKIEITTKINTNNKEISKLEIDLIRAKHAATDIGDALRKKLTDAVKAFDLSDSEADAKKLLDIAAAYKKEFGDATKIPIQSKYLERATAFTRDNNARLYHPEKIKGKVEGILNEVKFGPVNSLESQLNQIKGIQENLEKERLEIVSQIEALKQQSNIQGRINKAAQTEEEILVNFNKELKSDKDAYLAKQGKAEKELLVAYNNGIEVARTSGKGNAPIPDVEADKIIHSHAFDPKRNNLRFSDKDIVEQINGMFKESIIQCGEEFVKMDLHNVKSENISALQEDILDVYRTVLLRCGAQFKDSANGKMVLSGLDNLSDEANNYAVDLINSRIAEVLKSYGGSLSFGKIEGNKTVDTTNTKISDISSKEKELLNDFGVLLENMQIQAIKVLQDANKLASNKDVNKTIANLKGQATKELNKVGTELTQEDYNAVESKIQGIITKIEELGGNADATREKLERFKESVNIISGENSPALSSEDSVAATRAWIQSLEDAGEVAERTDKKIEEALNVSANQDAGSAVDLLTKAFEEQNAVIDENIEKKKRRKQVDEGTSDTAEGADKEAESLKDVEKPANDAAEAKQKFAEANAEVLKSIQESLKGLDSEGKAFENLNKLIKTLSKQNDMTDTVVGLQQIAKVLNEGVNDNSLVKVLQDIASEGENLKNLATVLKNANKVNKAKSAVEKENQVEEKPDKEVIENYNQQKANLKEIYNLKTRNAKIDQTSIESINNEKRIVELEGKQVDLKKALADASAENAAEEAKLLKTEEELQNKLSQSLVKELSDSKAEINKLLDTGSWTKEYEGNLKDLINRIDDLNNRRIDMDTESFRQELKALSHDIEDTIGEKSFARHKAAAETTLAKLENKIESVMASNSAMGNKFQKQFNNLKLRLDTAESVEDVKKITTEINKLESELKRTGKTGDNFFASLRNAAKSSLVQMVNMYLSFYDIVRYARQAFDTIQELDTALVDLKKTTTMNNSDLEEFYQNSSQIAAQTGVTTKEIISQAAAWSRLGYSSKEAATEMAKLSSQFAMISPGMDVEKATDGLVSTMKAFGVQVDDVVGGIMDPVNRIGNVMATSNEEIVNMLERSSAAMAAANNTLEQTIALESAAVQITRNAETTGTAFRTISMRIRGYDEETEEFIGNVAELTGKVADLTKTAKTPGGISLFTDETKQTYKSTYQILKDISEIYHDLTDKQQAALLETLAGKRGGQVLAGLLNDFSEVERAMAEMQTAAGSADAEMGIIEESLDFKINRLKETWVGALQEMIDRGDIGELIDNLTKLSEVLVNLIEHLGVGGSIVAGVGLRALFMNFDKIKGWLPNFINGIGEASKVAKSLKDVGTAAKVAEEATTPFMEAVKFLNSDADDVAEGLGTIGKAIGNVGAEAGVGAGELSGFGNILVSLAGATGISVGGLLALGGAITAVIASAGIMVYEYNKAEQEIAKFAKDLGRDFEESSKDIDEYKTEIESLYEIINSESSSTDQRREARERLLAIQDEMIGKYGAEARSIELITAAISGEISALDSLTEYQWDKAVREFNKTDIPGLDSWVRAFNGAEDNVELMLKKLENQTITLNFQSQVDSDFIKKIKDIYGGEISFNDETGISGLYTLSGNLDELQEKLVKIQKSAEGISLSDAFEDGLDRAINKNDDLLDSYGEFYKQYVLYERILGTDQEKHLKNINNLVQTYKTALANEQDEEAEKALQSLKEEYSDIEVGLSGLDEDTATSIRMFFENLPPMEIKVAIDKKQLREELDKTVEDGGTRGEQLAEAIGKFSNKEQLFNFDKDAKDAPKELKEAYEDLNNAVQDTGVSLEDIYDYLVNTKKVAKELPSAVADTAAKTLERKNLVNSGYSNLTGTEIYQSVIDIMSKLDEEQQLAWIHAAEKANDYTDAILRGNEAVEKLKETTKELNEDPIEFNMTGLSVAGKNLKTLQGIYSKFVDAVDNNEAIIHVDLTEVEDLRDLFQNVGIEEDFNIFEGIVTDANSSAEEIQAAFDSIATSYATAQINMQGANEQTAAILKSQLVEWGMTKESVDNFVDSLMAEAEEQKAVAQITEIVTDKNNEFKGSEDAKIQALMDEATQLGLTKTQLIEYLIKAHEAGFITFNGDTSFLERLRTELGLTIDEINGYKSALASIGSLRSQGYSSSTDGSSGKNGQGLNPNSAMGKRILEQQKAYKEKQKQKTLQDSKNGLHFSSDAAKSGSKSSSGGGGGGGGSKAKEEAKEEKDALQELSSQLDEVQDAWKKLDSIQKDYAETGKITVDQAQELINIDYRYLAMLNLEGDAMAVNEAAFQSLAQAKLSEMKITLIRKAIDLVNTFVDEAKAAEYLTQSYFNLGVGAAEAAGELAALYQAVANVSGMSQTQAQAANTVLQGTLNALKMLDHVDLSTAIGDDKDTKEKAEETKDEYEELFDYFERRVKVLQNAIEHLNAELENVNGSFAKNKLLDAQRGYNEQMLKDYTSALEMYQEKANEALNKLPSDIADKIKNGAVEITKFMGEANKDVVEAIKDYESWADKVADCRQQIAELKEALRQLELQKFNNIVEEFTAQFDIRQNSAIDLISKQIDLFSEAGQLIGTSFYAEQRNQTLKQIDLLQREKEKLVSQMNSALDNGVTAGTDEWQEMVTTLANVEGQILDCKKAVEEFDNSILALHTEIFERIQNVFAGFNDELENLNSVLEDFDVAEENGTWSKEGLTRLGIAAQQYEMAKYQVKQYDKEIQQLNSDYLAGKYSVTEYTDRLIELKGAQWDCVQASEAAKDAIVDLNKARVDIETEAINKEIDAYSDLISKQKEELQAQKDLHDYAKSIEEASKSIAETQRKLAALSGDNSAKAKAERARLQKTLSDQQADLEEKQYQHGITAQQEALDQELESFKEEKDAEIEKLNEYLENTEQLLVDSFETIKAHAAEIGNTMSETAAKHGVEISSALTASWQSGEMAIASYGAALSSGTSAFIGELEKVEFKTWELKAQADTTAEGLAQMFATSADYLISELQASYDSEENLDAMTNALHANLIDTLESNYNTSGITEPIKEISNAANDAINALNGMQSAAGAARDAANEATNAINRMNSAKSSSPSSSGSSPSSSSSSGSEKWYAKTYDGTVVKEFSSYNQAELWRKHKDSAAGTYLTSNKKYATGLRKADEDELAWTQELGDEIILSPTRSSILTPIKKNDAVLTKEMTDNLWKWASISPDIARPELAEVPTINNIQSLQSMNFGSMIQITGSTINDSVEMMKIAAQQAAKEVTAGFKKLESGLYK